jgi:hypothetical protein
MGQKKILLVFGVRIGLTESSLLKLLKAHFKLPAEIGVESLHATAPMSRKIKKIQQFLFCSMLQVKLLFPFPKLLPDVPSY